jgi:hypothetical protein
MERVAWKQLPPDSTAKPKILRIRNKWIFSRKMETIGFFTSPRAQVLCQTSHGFSANDRTQSQHLDSWRASTNMPQSDEVTYVCSPHSPSGLSQSFRHLCAQPVSRTAPYIGPLLWYSMYCSGSKNICWQLGAGLWALRAVILLHLPWTTVHRQIYPQVERQRHTNRKTDGRTAR